jgi:hypothetical protein
MNSIADSVNQLKKAGAAQDIFHEKSKCISLLRFSKDDRLSRVTDCLSIGKRHTLEFDMAHDARYRIFGWKLFHT